jgi:hypothetical protein
MRLPDASPLAFLFDLVLESIRQALRSRSQILTHPRLDTAYWEGRLWID